jgi:hypothetical protein
MLLQKILLHPFPKLLRSEARNSSQNKNKKNGECQCIPCGKAALVLGL